MQDEEIGRPADEEITGAADDEFAEDEEDLDEEDMDEEDVEE
jgi:hypothetical protein